MPKGLPSTKMVPPNETGGKCWSSLKAPMLAPHATNTVFVSDDFFYRAVRMRVPRSEDSQAPLVACRRNGLTWLLLVRTLTHQWLHLSCRLCPCAPLFATPS